MSHSRHRISIVGEPFCVSEKIFGQEAKQKHTLAVGAPRTGEAEPLKVCVLQMCAPPSSNRKPTVVH